ncbi:MAG TPA: MFS transporter [Acidobacteriota bacterium]|nr:MFS transporter [Acidobacteriota bacterium]
MTEQNPSPSSRPPIVLRWSVLAAISIAMFGNYYIYDSIAPVAPLLTEQLGFTDSMIGSLNAIYSLSSILLLFLAGPLIDRFGTRNTTVVFTALCVVGAVVTALSGDHQVMLAGRFIFGLGAESMIVAITTALAKWFRGKELGLAFGVNLMVARAGAAAAQSSTGWFESLYDDWQKPLFMAAIVGISSLIAAAVYWVLEKQAEEEYALGAAGETDRLVWSDLLKFSRSYWFIVGLCATFYSAIFPFQTFGVKFLSDNYDLPLSEAGPMLSVISFSAIFATPVFGFLADWMGRRSHLMVIGSVLIMPVYLMMAHTGLSPYIPIAMMGVAYSLIPAVMWPSVAYVVDERRLGTAYALMTLLQQAGVAGLNLAVGAANDYGQAGAANPGGYQYGMWLFSLLGFVGLFFALQLNRAEAGPGGHGLDTITVKSADEKVDAAGAAVAGQLVEEPESSAENAEEKGDDRS